MISLKEFKKGPEQGSSEQPKRQLPPEFLRMQEIIDRNKQIAAELRADGEEIEERKKRRDDTPGGMAVKIMKEEIPLLQYETALNFLESIEDPSEEESAILNELLACAERIGAGVPIEEVKPQIAVALQKTIALKIARTGKGFLNVDGPVLANQLQSFAKVAIPGKSLQEAVSAMQKTAPKKEFKP